MTKYSNTSYPRAVIDELTDFRDAEVMDVSVKSQCAHLTIVLSTGEVVIALAGGMISFGFNMLPRLRIIVVAVVLLAFGDVAPASHITDAQAGVMIDMLSAILIVVATCIPVAVLASLDSEMRAATMIASDLALLSDWETFSCWLIAAWNCRALQA